MIGNHVNPQGFPGFESLSLRPIKQAERPATAATPDEGEGVAVCTSVCTPPSEAALEAAISRLTSALGTAADETIAELVAERRALREELHALREASVNVARDDEERVRGDRGR